MELGLYAIAVVLVLTGATIIRILTRISRNLAGIHAILFVNLNSAEQKNTALEIAESMAKKKGRG